MNLDANPTKEQLRDLLARCDDETGHHILWVTRSGQVEITRVSEEVPPAEFERDHPDMQMRCETFQAGNEYVGPEAVADDAWVEELFESLMEQWKAARGRAEVEYIDQF